MLSIVNNDFLLAQHNTRETMVEWMCHQYIHRWDVGVEKEHNRLFSGYDYSEKNGLSSGKMGFVKPTFRV